MPTYPGPPCNFLKCCLKCWTKSEFCPEFCTSAPEFMPWKLPLFLPHLTKPAPMRSCWNLPCFVTCLLKLPLQDRKIESIDSQQASESAHHCLEIVVGSEADCVSELGGRHVYSCTSKLIMSTQVFWIVGKQWHLALPFLHKSVDIYSGHFIKILMPDHLRSSSLTICDGLGWSSYLRWPGVKSLHTICGTNLQTSMQK